MHRRKQRTWRSGWRIGAANPEPSHIRYYESLFSLANGTTGIRGLREEAVVSSKNHPLALIAEVYDRPPRTQSTAPNATNSTRLAPAPNWLRIRFSDGSGWFSTDGVGVLAESYELDMRRGVLERRVRYRSRSGRITRITVRRIVSQARPHVAAIQYSVCPENYRGRVELRSMLDGAATYPDRVPQTEERAKGREDETVWLVVRTLETADRHRPGGPPPADLRRPGGRGPPAPGPRPRRDRPGVPLRRGAGTRVRPGKGRGD